MDNSKQLKTKRIIIITILMFIVGVIIISIIGIILRNNNPSMDADNSIPETITTIDSASGVIINNYGAEPEIGDSLTLIGFESLLDFDYDTIRYSQIIQKVNTYFNNIQAKTASFVKGSFKKQYLDSLDAKFIVALVDFNMYYDVLLHTNYPDIDVTITKDTSFNLQDFTLPPTITFENSFLLEYSVGKKLSSEILDLIKNAIDYNIPNEEISLSIYEPSYERSIHDNSEYYKFSITSSEDDRPDTYQVYSVVDYQITSEDSDKTTCDFIAVIIKRQDIENSTPQLYVKYSQNADQQSAHQKIIDWAQSLDLGEVHEN